MNNSILSTNRSIEQKVNLLEFEERGVKVYVKRDDRIHPFISGNKWRKLKYNYASFLNSGCKGIVTFGGAYSNHIIATAAFCAENKIKCVGIIRGEEPKVLNPVLILAKLWGMELQFASWNEYGQKDLLVEPWINQGYYSIPEGGDNNDGSRGCSELLDELTLEYDHIFCASGTGCTIAGIVKGVNLLKLKTHCHSIPVLKQGEFISDRIHEEAPTAKNFTVHTTFHCGGYAKTTPELFRFINYLAKETGILTDPIYTAKVFYALIDLVKDGYFNKGETILVIHTGGLTGLLSEKMLSAVQNSIK